MRIIRLVAENFMGVEAIDITPVKHLNRLGGENGSGKSSTLNSILSSFGGAKALADVPLRRGAKKGLTETTVDHPNGDIVVKRTFSADGKTTLTITAADGTRLNKPQELLDSFVGPIGFDPEEFSRLDRKKQADQLRSLVGIDFTSLDVKRQQTFEKRTIVNRDVKRLEGALSQLPRVADAPKEEIKLADLMAEKERADAHNRGISERAKARDAKRREAEMLLERIEEIDQEIERLKVLRAEKSAAHVNLTAELLDEEDAAKDDVGIDTSNIVARIQNADALNAKFRQAQERARVAAELREHEEQAEKLTAEIERIDEEKSAALAAAKWPVPGLGFDGDGVTYNGLPFDQACSSEKIRVSLAIGMAMNPELRVLLIRNGSLIDEKQMDVIREMVETMDFQVFSEEVSSDGKGCTVVISEGRVAAESAVHA